MSINTVCDVGCYKNESKTKIVQGRQYPGAKIVRALQENIDMRTVVRHILLYSEKNEFIF